MEKQNISNHIKYYFPHHFILYPVLTILTGISIYSVFAHHHQWMLWSAITVIFVIMGCMAFMMRQHYALTLQDRIVRLEMRLRYYQLTQRRLEFIEYKLTLDQLAALRFASDDQLPFLINETIEEKLKPIQIKRRIKNWTADLMRV